VRSYIYVPVVRRGVADQSLRPGQRSVSRAFSRLAMVSRSGQPVPARTFAMVCRLTPDRAARRFADRLRSSMAVARRRARAWATRAPWWGRSA
jgi:hypothetical protein